MTIKISENRHKFGTYSIMSLFEILIVSIFDGFELLCIFLNTRFLKLLKRFTLKLKKFYLYFLRWCVLQERQISLIYSFNVT